MRDLYAYGSYDKYFGHIIRLVWHTRISSLVGIALHSSHTERSPQGLWTAFAKDCANAYKETDPALMSLVSN